MACDGDFCDDYLLLKPEKGEVSDLFRLLFSKNINHNKFLDCPSGTEITEARRRWLICVSLTAQVILLRLKNPLSWAGSAIERWLNLLSENTNFYALILNQLQGEFPSFSHITIIYIYIYISYSLIRCAMHGCMRHAPDDWTISCLETYCCVENVQPVPDLDSASYKSFIGFLDERLGLDKDIKKGDNRYHAALSVMAAKLSYENETFIKSTVTDKWKMEFVEYYHCWNDYQEQFSTQAFMLMDKSTAPELIVISFRGTESFNAVDWSTDVDFSFYELRGMGKVHAGFMKALGLQKNQGWPKEIEQGEKKPAYAYYAIREKLRDVLRKNDNAKFILTGHSLGGALAVLFPAILAVHKEVWMLERLAGVYTFGQPRVGDEKLGKFVMEQLNKHGGSYYRFVYSNDIVPRLPYDDTTLWFKHFGTCLYYNSFYVGKIVAEEPNKNYFSLWTVLPKLLTAEWEVVRSFAIGYIKGRDYREGWVLRMLRVIGLVFPGFPAHTPQDYVNATRLGTSLITHDQIIESSKLD
ncbi:triacylglycerol lipase OBL1-like [Magnolia sinica]|uniref:triacylglycerol lipase OBL1-like n=1 Tax=Magnolia sinica TaxID=86752 RepID=UPI002659CEC2|nr:triacylglycerol lipase OBL1-like [Magnolia sinica]